MTVAYRINGALIPYQTVRLNGSDNAGGVAGLPSSAWYGEPMIAGITIEDETGTLDLTGWSVFTADETACVGKERIFTGWITGKTISRGPYVSGAGRVWDCDIIDQNACLSFEVYRANSAKRPAETDLARVTFCLGSGPMAGTPVVAGSLTDLTNNPVNLQEADHTRQYPVELLTSTAGRAGKIFFVFWSQSQDRLELFYDLPTEFPLSSLSISNVSTEVNGTSVFAPDQAATLERSPENLYTGMLLDYVGGAVYQRRQATIDILSPTPLSPINFLRDFHRQSDAIGLASTANAVVAADLEQRASEEDTIRCRIQVPASVVNEIDAGMSMSVKFSHFPGYSTAQTINVIRCTKTPTAGQDAVYDVFLELSNRVKIREQDGGDPHELPHQDACQTADVTLVQSTTAVPTNVTGTTAKIVLDQAPTPGNLQVVVSEFDDPVPANSITMTGFTEMTSLLVAAPATQAFRMQGWRRVAQDGDTTDLVFAFTGASARRVTYMEFSGNLEFDQIDTNEVESDDVTPLVAGPVTPTSGKVALLVSAVVPALNVGDGWDATPAAGPTQAEEYGTSGASPYIWAGYQVVASTSGSYSHSLTYTDGGILRGYASFIASFICNADTCPPTGQWVRDEFVASGDGTTTTFTTACPYATASLRVRVDGVPIITGLTETNPAAGTFTLDFAPLAAQGDAPAEQVYVDYQGR